MCSVDSESKACLESAVRMLRMDRSEMSAEDIVLMVYNLGRIDGARTQLETDNALRKAAHGL